MNKYEEYMEYYYSMDLYISNESIDNRTFIKEDKKFHDKFFTKAKWDENTSIHDLLVREGKSELEYTAKHIQHLVKTGVFKLVKKENDEREDN